MKQFYKENRVFSILMLVVIGCIILTVVMILGYVISSSSKSVYGNRLDGIGDVKIDSKMNKDLVSKVQEMDKVSSAKVNVHGKIVYFDIVMSDDASVDDAKNTAIKCLGLFEEDYLNFYDIQFLMTNDKFVNNSSQSTEDNIFPILGYRKAQKTTITWSHNANR